MKHTLKLERVFPAPRALVWSALSDPAQALQWMGPEDFPAVKYESEQRVGGAWRACLRATGSEHVPDGTEIWQGGVIRELVPGERLSFTFRWDEPDAIETLVTFELRDEAGGTRMTFRQEPFTSTDSRDSHAGGWTSTFDRLHRHLTKR